MLAKALTAGMDVGKRRWPGRAWRSSTTPPSAAAGWSPSPARCRADAGIELDGTRGWFAEKDAFVGRREHGQLRHRVPGFKTGRKGGEGFVLEKFTGAGTLFIAGAGNFIDLNPAKYGGKIQVDTGCMVAFQDT